METVVIVIHLMIVLALVGVVLLQRSEGGGLGIGGGSGFMTARGAANALTRATAILAVAFFVTSLGLSIIARYGERPIDILDRVPQRLQQRQRRPRQARHAGTGGGVPTTTPAATTAPSRAVSHLGDRPHRPVGYQPTAQRRLRPAPAAFGTPATAPATSQPRVPSCTRDRRFGCQPRSRTTKRAIGDCQLWL